MFVLILIRSIFVYIVTNPFLSQKFWVSTSLKTHFVLDHRCKAGDLLLSCPQTCCQYPLTQQGDGEAAPSPAASTRLPVSSWTRCAWRLYGAHASFSCPTAPVIRQFRVTSDQITTGVQPTHGFQTICVSFNFLLSSPCCMYFCFAFFFSVACLLTLDLAPSREATTSNLCKIKVSIFYGARQEKFIQNSSLPFGLLCLRSSPPQCTHVPASGITKPPHWQE